MQCTHCQGEVQADWKACPHCGEAIVAMPKCAECGKELDAKWKACPACGANLSDGGQPAPAGGVAVADAVVKCDIVKGDVIKGDVARDQHIHYHGAGGHASPQLVECPHCGRQNELRDTFRCRECKRSGLCQRHLDDAAGMCEECATKTATANLRPGSMITNSIGMRLAFVPPGTFMMGSPEDESERKNDETQHEVTLTKGFYMGVMPVTQVQWRAVMGTDPSEFKGDERPVESVSWDDAQAFCRKLSAQEGKEYRLLTEAEWEYACRAGTTTPFCFGETIGTDQANYKGSFVYGDGREGVYREETTAVGRFPPNPWGLHDMHGNVWEWCEDWYGGYGRVVTDPLGPLNGEIRVMRGGSWGFAPESCRSAYRSGDSPDARYISNRFRVVLDLN